MRTLLTAAVIATCLACPALGQAYDLRGPAADTQSTLVTRTQMQSEQSDVTINTGGQRLTGQMTTATTQVVETTVLEMDGDQPIRVRSAIVESVTNNNMNFNGQAQNQQDRSAQGLVMVQTLADEVWRTEVIEGTLPAEAIDIIRHANYAEPRLGFPENAVEVGSTWTLTDTEIQSLMGMSGMPGSRIEGEVTFHLDAVTEIDGERVAAITYTMDCNIVMDMQMPDNAAFSMQMTMQGEGNILRNLSTYATQNDFDGDMAMQVRIKAGNETVMDMTAELPVTTSTTQETVPIPAE